MGLLDSLSEWWLNNFTLRREFPVDREYKPAFQVRRTGVPGVVTNEIPPSAAAVYYSRTPSGMIQDLIRYGVETDQDTRKGLVNLYKEWKARENRYPNEGHIEVRPMFVRRPILDHESAHSLYNQIVSSEEGNRYFGDLANRLKLFQPRGVSNYNRGNEALAYEIMDHNQETKGQDYVQAIIDSAKSPLEKAAAQRLLALYFGRPGALAK